jgi:hypothetical protein
VDIVLIANNLFCIAKLHNKCAVLPDTSGGFNRSEFERNLRDNLLVFFTAMFPPEREEDVFNAINWYYSPWPHVDDVYANRDAFNFVSARNIKNVVPSVSYFLLHT